MAATVQDAAVKYPANSVRYPDWAKDLVGRPYMQLEMRACPKYIILSARWGKPSRGQGSVLERGRQHYSIH
jgi:hypothetical protein